jgi:hypothetical protein
LKFRSIKETNNFAQVETRVVPQKLELIISISRSSQSSVLMARATHTQYHKKKNTAQRAKYR